MATAFNERFTCGIDIDQRHTKAREIGNIVLEASQLTDDFTAIERIPRLSNSRRENDVEHSYMLALAAPAIAERYYPNLDTDKVRRFALIHDLLEVEVGDVATFDLTSAELAEKDRREQVAKRIVKNRLAKISSNVATDLEEYDNQDTSEAVFVRMVDKLLPVAVDVTGDGLRVIREDYGVADLISLEVSHNQLYERMLEKFGKDFPDLVAAHAVLVVDFEEKYKANPDENLKVKETVRGPIETERKFLVDKIPEDIELSNIPHTILRQGYVVVSSDGAETRIRSFDNERFELTVKSAGTIQRSEQTIKLPKDMFEVLWAQTAGMRVEKTRYKIPYGKNVIELDIYEGHLTGLITAEVEFSGRPEEAEVKATTFEAPAWFGRDVTKDRRYKNQNLAYGIPREPLHLGSKQL
ncbi:MAG TPA: HD domain-containing protein [Candidatus Saccharimonadales bacterium]|nr:HD domain-containing protein [Candidatus Saccharimonadales bacterium]